MIKKDIEQIIIKTFAIKEYKYNKDDGPSDIEGWDSLGFVNLISEIENTFNIEFDIMELIEINNIGNIVEAIESKGIN